jgi:hypothetical protein
VIIFLKHRTNAISRNLTRQTKTSQQGSSSGERERERAKDEMQKNCVVRRIHTYIQACMQKRRKKAKNQTKNK